MSFHSNYGVVHVMSLLTFSFSAEPFNCNGPCPCQIAVQPVIYHVNVNECAYCRNPFAFGEDYSPVCIEDNETLYNECEARCK